MRKKKKKEDKNNKKILINIEPKEYRVAIVENSRLQEFFIERPDDHTVVGNIYKGKIDSVVPSVGAYFVDIGLEKKGFLYIQDTKDYLMDQMELVNGDNEQKKIKSDLKKGDDVLVQVEKEPFSTKGARLTTHISIPGKYLVLVPNETGIGISKKIEDRSERNRLRGIIKELNLKKDLGLIVRTASAGKDKKDFLRDAHFLKKVWQRIQTAKKRRKSPSLIYEEYELPIRVIRDVYGEDIDEIIVDEKNYYKNIVRFVKTYMPHLSNRINYFKQDIPLFEFEKVESQIQDLYETKISMKSGAYLVIEPTEGLVVIDVNSGRFKTRKDQENAALAVNLEAAQEIARQARLRDLGGIIVIDFIDMHREENRKKLVNSFRNFLSRDRSKTDILGLSKFGVLQMTRQRTRRTIESIHYQNCPYCKGRGKIKSASAAATAILRDIKQYLSTHPKGNVIRVTLNPKIKEILLNSYQRSLRTIQRHFRKRIEFLVNDAMHIEEMIIN